jgi:hypothetical protein
MTHIRFLFLFKGAYNAIHLKFEILMCPFGKKLTTANVYSMFYHVLITTRCQEAWRWPLTHFYCRCQERVELYLYFPYGPYGLYKGALCLYVISDVYLASSDERGCVGERGHCGDQDADGGVILRWIFRKLEGVVETGWSWLRIGTGGGHLWVRREFLD